MSYQIQPIGRYVYVVTHTDTATMVGVSKGDTIGDTVGVSIIWGASRQRGTTEVVDSQIVIDGVAWPSWSWRDGPDGVWTHEVCETDHEANVIARCRWPYSKDHVGFDAEGYWR